VVAIRLDPSRLDFSLDTATSDYGMQGAWTIDALPPASVLAFNAGQFTGGYPEGGWCATASSRANRGMERSP
jgi:hypothetical protein